MLYLDKNQTPEARADDLLPRLTIDEKVLQLASFFPNGVARLSIPNLQPGECLHGLTSDYATSFPQAIALGSTWDPELVEKVSTVIARECRALGVHHCYTPMLGVARDARWGRIEEAYGEDPCLVAEIGAGFINGLQGVGEEHLDSNHVIATAKHFVGDAEPIGGANGAPVDISERQLREVHLVPFEKAVKEAHVRSIMPAHHALNGRPCHINDYILKTILREEYGFDGSLVSDNGDIRMLVQMGIAEDLQHAAEMALKAGVDSELAWLCPMGPNRAYGFPIRKSLEEGKIDVAVVDAAVRNVLISKFRLGLFEEEGTIDGDSGSFWEFQGDETGDEHIHYADTQKSFGKKRDDWKDVVYAQDACDLARESAVKAMILLKNENNLLPLNPEKLKKLAIIGPNSDTRVLGGYSTKNPRYFVSILEGFKNALPECEITQAFGCNPHNFMLDDLDNAIKCASEAETVILCVGGNEETCKENQDVDTLDLPGEQIALINAVCAVNKNVVMMLLQGRPNSIQNEIAQCDAVIEGFYLGQETGNAIADVILGKRCPGGKLPVTMARSAGQMPLYYNRHPQGRAINYYGADCSPIFPFGFGLSYTNFEFSEPVMNRTEGTWDDQFTISVDVTNTGDCVGDEVVQLYVHDDLCSLTRPCKELKAFKRVTIAPKETKTISFDIKKDMLRFWSDKGWTWEDGVFTLMIGNSSENLQNVKITIAEK